MHASSRHTGEEIGPSATNPFAHVLENGSFLRLFRLSPIWFGVVLVLTAEVGMITPPVGMNCFVVARYTGRPVEEIFAGIWPHFIAHILAIIFFTAFPGVVLWLPTTMGH